jgi:DNA-binding NarL/FixJ family response regulator
MNNNQKRNKKVRRLLSHTPTTAEVVAQGGNGVPPIGASVWSVPQEPANSPGQHILIVEDSEGQLAGMFAVLHSRGWQIDVAKSPIEALNYLEEAKVGMRPLPHVISIDLGLMELIERPDYGLELLETIGNQWEGIELVVHSSIPRKQGSGDDGVDETTVRRVMTQGASYFYLRDQPNLLAYADMLPYVLKGYVVYSPMPALLLREIARAKPTPFVQDEKALTTLKKLHEGKTYREIADEERLAEQTIRSRVANIYSALVALGEISSKRNEGDETPIRAGEYREAVLSWYRKNKWRLPNLSKNH